MIFLLALSLFNIFNAKLLSVHVLTRHGDKEPAWLLKYNPNIPHNGNLLRKGKERLEAIGTELRNRYLQEPDFLPNYSDQRYYFYATDYNRTRESLLSLAYGLFPPGTGPKVDSNNNEPHFVFPNGTQPVPIHSVAHERELKFLSSYLCPNGLDLIHKHYNSPAYQTLFKEVEPFINKVVKAVKTEETGDNLVEVLDAVKSLILMDNDDYKLPSSLTDEDLKELLRVSNLISSYSIPSTNKQFCDITLGTFIEEVFFSHFPSTISNITYYHYSAHDVSHIALEECLGFPIINPYNESNPVYEVKNFPEYGAILTIEARTDSENNGNHDENNPLIQFFIDFTPDPSKPLNLTEIIPDFCPSTGCDLQTIQTHFQHIHTLFEKNTFLTSTCGFYIPTPEVDEHSPFSSQSSLKFLRNSVTWMIAGFSLVIVVYIALIVVVILYFLIKRLKKKSSDGYGPLIERSPTN